MGYGEGKITITIPQKWVNWITGEYCKCGRKRTVHGWDNKKTCYPCWNKEIREMKKRVANI